MSNRYNDIRLLAIERAHLLGKYKGSDGEKGGEGSFSAGDRRAINEQIHKMISDGEVNMSDIDFSGVDPRVRAALEQSNEAESLNSLEDLEAEAAASAGGLESLFSGNGDGTSMNTLDGSEAQADKDDDDGTSRVDDQPDEDGQSEETDETPPDSAGEPGPKETQTTPETPEETGAESPATQPEGEPPIGKAVDAGGDAAKAAEGAGEAGADAAATAAGEAAAATAAETAAAAEAAAAAGAAATEAGAATVVAAESNPVGWVITAVIIVFILLVILFLFIFAAFPDSAGGCENGTSTTVTELSLGSPNSGGYYQLPENSNYDVAGVGGNTKSSRDLQWGGKTLIETLNIAATGWNAAHPDQRLWIGDLNAPGHASHLVGVDLDIFSPGGVFMQLPDHSSNSKYDPKLATELGKLLLDTGAVEYIFYNDRSVVDALNAYKGTKGVSGTIEPWPDYGSDDHKNHFHLRVVANAKPNGTLSGSTSGSTSCPAKDGYTAPADVLKYCQTDYGFYDTAQGKAIFGSSASEVEAQLVEVDFPTTDPKIRVHKKAAPCFEQVGKEIRAANLNYRMQNDGTYEWRLKSSGSSLSMHSFGIAIDINYSANPYGPKETPCPSNMPAKLPEIFKKYGFSWGGEWNSLCDAMHYEWHGANK